MAFGILYDFLMGQTIEAHNYFGAHFVDGGVVLDCMLLVQMMSQSSENGTTGMSVQTK